MGGEYDGPERRVDSKALFQMRGEISALQATADYTKESVDKLNNLFDTKLSALAERGLKRDAAVERLADTVNNLAGIVKENGQMIHEHVKNDVTPASWISSKVVWVVVVVAGMVGAAFVNQYVIPSILPERGANTPRPVYIMPNLPEDSQRHSQPR
jgi:hypothetical protein